jgi:hypothetical protein
MGNNKSNSILSILKIQNRGEKGTSHDIVYLQTQELEGINPFDSPQSPSNPLESAGNEK